MPHTRYMLAGSTHDCVGIVNSGTRPRAGEAHTGRCPSRNMRAACEFRCRFRCHHSLGHPSCGVRALALPRSGSWRPGARAPAARAVATAPAGEGRRACGARQGRRPRPTRLRDGGGIHLWDVACISVPLKLQRPPPASPRLAHACGWRGELRGSALRSRRRSRRSATRSAPHSLWVPRHGRRDGLTPALSGAVRPSPPVAMLRTHGGGQWPLAELAADSELQVLREHRARLRCAWRPPHRSRPSRSALVPPVFACRCLHRRRLGRCRG